MFPMISCSSEIRQAKVVLHEVADELEKEGLDFNRDIEVGILIEVPSAVFTADLMADECDFFSIGTNDLIQYAFAIDRENKKVLHLNDPLHPAVIRMIKHVVGVARDKGVKVSICGEMAAEPLYVPLLLGLGLDELSVNPQSIPAVKRLIRTLRLEDAKQFTKKIVTLTDAADIMALIQDNYGDMVADDLYGEQ